MADPSLPRRWFSWVCRRWLRLFTPCRRPVVRATKLTLIQLEDRFSPTSMAVGALLETAPPPQLNQFNSAMRSAPGEFPNLSDAHGVTASERIQLVFPSSPAKQTDSPVFTTSSPPEETSFVPQSRSNAELAALDSWFSQPSARHASPPRAQGDNNAPNAQAQSSGGGGIGGVSTPNAGGGGSGGGSSGAGPGVINANQFLSANLNTASSVLTVGAAATTAAPSHAAATLAVQTAAPAVSAHVAPIVSLAAPTHTTHQTEHHHSPPPPPSHGHGHKHGHGSDPLYVLDMNTGETLSANATLNTFSTWSENLQAQVSGGAVMIYTWDTSNAPDLTNIVQNGASLQGAWTSFTGTARTDTIIVTEHGQGMQSLSQTMTFLVAGTDSPGYSSSRPTSSATWPSVVTPDRVTAQQATQPGGPYASLGLTDGSVQTAFAMPSYNPNVAPVSLDYNSTTANAQPIFLAEYQLPTGQAVPATITAQLTFNGTPGSTIVYNTSSLNPGDWVQIALQGNATGLSTGRYPWQIAVTNGTATNYSGNVDIVNQASSPFGAGWSLSNVEQLVPVTGSGVILVQPGGTSLWFANGQQSGTFVTPAGDFSTLLQNQNGTYTRTMTDGTAINFDSTGRQTSTVDRDGNTTTFGYSSGQLTTITDWNNQTTTLAYTGGQLTSITDPANRHATLAYTGAQLTSIADPANDVWGYGYDTSNRLTTLTDPLNHATTFAYNFAGRVATVTQADNSTEKLNAEQMNGLAAPGTGTTSNPATAVLLATGAEAQYTDANNQVWTTGLDWLGFGLDTADIDPLGDAALTYRDANGLPWMSADQLGRRSRQFFDNKGNTTEAVAPDDTTLRYSYNQFSQVTQYTDQENNVTTNTYNTKGDRTQTTDALNDITTYSYNTPGLVTGTTDPLHHATTYGYDALNRLTSVVNALNQTTTLGYDSASNQTSSIDARGFTSTFAFDPMGRMTGQTLPDSLSVFSTSTFTYDKVGNQTAVTDPLNHTTTSGFDALNRLTGVTDPLNHTLTYGYDAAGDRTSMTDALNEQTTYGYDAARRQTSMTDATGAQTTYAYDAANEQTSVTDALGRQTLTTYTPRGQVASKGLVNSLGGPQVSYAQIKTYSYGKCRCVDSITLSGLDGDNDNDVPGDPLESSEGSGSFIPATITYRSDAVHRVTGITDTLGHTTTFGYDAASNKTSVTDALNHTTTYGFDALNRLTGATDPLNHTLTYSYDAAGNQTSVTDALNRTTTSTFDAQNRPLTVTDPRGGVTSYTYDLAGNQKSITDSVGNQTTYGYDTANRLTATTDPLNHATTYAYDAANQLTSQTDRDGRTTTFGYDHAGRMTNETWVGGNYTATYTFDRAGQVTAAQDPFSSYTYTYDKPGDVTSVDNAGTPGVPHVVLSYVYDGMLNRTSLTDSLGGSLSYVYNVGHQLTSMSLSANMVQAAQLTFGYDAANRLTSVTRPGGMMGMGPHTIATSYSYDNADRLTNIAHTDTTASTTLANYTYGFDAANQLTSYQDTNSSLTYGYDRASELTSAAGTLNGSSYGVTYSYDTNGNRNMAGYTTGLGNELTSDGVFNYTYDNEGNTLTQTQIATGTVTYFTWDYRNRLTEVQVKDSHGTLLNDEKFTYDVYDNRIGVMLNGVQQLYTVYDGANPYIDFNGSGALTQRYLTDPRGLSQFYGQVSASGATEWYLTDVINSIRQVVSTTGTSLDAITYDPYGSIVSQTNAANAPRFGYTGAAFDSLTGVNQDGGRQENPANGRFRGQDSWGLVPGPNPYEYVGNSPVDALDPTGHDSLTGYGGNGGGVGGLGYNPFPPRRIAPPFLQPPRGFGGGGGGGIIGFPGGGGGIGGLPGGGGIGGLPGGGGRIGFPGVGIGMAAFDPFFGPGGLSPVPKGSPTPLPPNLPIIMRAPGGPEFTPLPPTKKLPPQPKTRPPWLPPMGPTPPPIMIIFPCFEELFAPFDPRKPQPPA